MPTMAFVFQFYDSVVEHNDRRARGEVLVKPEDVNGGCRRILAGSSAAVRSRAASCLQGMLHRGLGVRPDDQGASTKPASLRHNGQP
jgi:hypothetical protein